jgi:glycosyltransferase involved in cell wall biosynthesis
MMKFSLVTGTCGRDSELERLFTSLAAQTYKNFELILVDQNEDDRVRRLVDIWRNRFDVLHLHSPRGLSRARNLGLAHVSGSIVAFPDDDCWYAEDLLEKVVDRFNATPQLGGLTGMSIDEAGRPSQGRWGTEARQIDRVNIWTSATSYTIFLSAWIFCSGS